MAKSQLAWVLRQELEALAEEKRRKEAEARHKELGGPVGGGLAWSDGHMS